MELRFLDLQEELEQPHLAHLSPKERQSWLEEMARRYPGDKRRISSPPVVIYPKMVVKKVIPPAVDFSPILKAIKELQMAVTTNPTNWWDLAWKIAMLITLLALVVK